MASSSMLPLTERSVVSSFIFKFDGGQPRVALFRRSGQVRTYRHHLAPISGSIDKSDESPLAAAWRELAEETTLSTADLALLRQGKSFSFGDEAVGRRWTIYPFAFRLRTAAEGGGGERAVRIDGEHEDWGWHDPLAVEDSEVFGGVPRLAESLRRVWLEPDLGPAAAGILSNGLERLRADHEDGGSTTAVSLQILSDMASELAGATDMPDKWWAGVRIAAWHLWKNGRENREAAVAEALTTALGSVEAVLREHRALTGFHGESTTTATAGWRDAALADLGRKVGQRKSGSPEHLEREWERLTSDL